MTLTLVPVTRENLDAVCALDAGDNGVQVASNQRSMAQAAVYPEAWPRAIMADGQLVGFLMLYDPLLTPTPEHREAELWRLMIDRRHQRRGHGRAAVLAVIEHMRTRCDALYLSYVDGPTSPAHFYRGLGFEPTGEVEDGEVVMVLRYAPR